MKNQKILLIAIPAFFACLSTVLVALFNPDLVRTVVDIAKDAATPTAVFTQTSPVPGFIATNTPVPFPTLAPVESTALSTPILSCPWMPYLNGVQTSFLSDENCLNDLKGVGISGDAKQISFAVHGRKLGTYGVCRDISKEDNLAFRVVVQDNIVSARFLVTVGAGPVPNRSSYAFRIQPEIQSKQEKDIYVKFVQYAPEGIDTDINIIQAISSWKHLENWGFNFSFQFSGSQANASMNSKLLEEWSLKSPNRYLCFVYQATPTKSQAVELDAQVQFP
jgi:hypothetical protein